MLLSRSMFILFIFMICWCMLILWKQIPHRNRLQTAVEVFCCHSLAQHFHCKNSSDNTYGAAAPQTKTSSFPAVSEKDRSKRSKVLFWDACNEKVMGKKDDMKGLKLTDLRIVYIFKYVYIQFWVWPPPSNSDHQDFCMFTRRFQPKTFICHWNPGKGGTPNTSYVYRLNPGPNKRLELPSTSIFGLPAASFRRVFLEPSAVP